MKRNLFYLFSMLLALASCKQEPAIKTQALTMGQLTLSTDKPKPGEHLDLRYHTDKEVEAFYAYMVGSKNYPIDIDFSEQDGEQKGSIKVPDSAVALAFYIKANNKLDNNNKDGYLLPLYQKDGQQLPGSSSAIAYFKLRQGDHYNISSDESQTLNTIKSELDAHPGLKPEWEVAYLQLLYRTDKEAALPLIDAYAAAVDENPKAIEKEYNSAMQLFAMLRDKEKEEAFKQKALKNFPKGDIANYELIDQFQQEGNLDKKATIFETFANANPKLGNIGNYMASTLARTYYQQKDLVNFEKYMSLMDDKSNEASILNNLAWTMAERGTDLDQAEKMSKTSLELITELQKNPVDKPDFYTKNQYDQALKSSYSMYADTYAFILFNQGKVKEAITYQEQAHDPQGRDVNANQRYLDYLIADNQTENVKEKAEQFIKLGQANDKIKEAYKAAYLELNPDATASAVTDNLIAFEKEAYASQVTEIKENMLDEEAPVFALKDMNGDEVSLQSLSGKVVILDFWATWCGPCKASFPGMQEVVTKYKNDDAVALLFVDTFERGPNREKMVEDFIKENNYTFDVIYDTEIEGSNSFEVADKYNINGIPTKAIIGPDGKLRFKTVGYGGSNEKMIQELDIMIDILRS